jgi:DNA topoisomerase-1
MDPATQRLVVARNGRYGPYVTEVLGDDPPKGVKPKTSSLFKSMSLDTITLDDALRLLTLPRLVGVDPTSGEEILALNGRYGPYLKKGADSRSLDSEEQLFSITLDQALAIYAEPKQRGGRAASGPLRELGQDPASERPVVVKDGRFGPYVTDGEFNATLRKGDSVEAITLQRAAELLAEKRANGPAPKRRVTKKATAKKSTAKKSAGATRSAAKKSTAKAT